MVRLNITYHISSTGRSIEEIKACIVLKEGSSCKEEDIINFAKSKIAAYKYPRIIEFYESLPLNATGKILKTELRN